MKNGTTKDMPAVCRRTYVSPSGRSAVRSKWRGAATSSALALGATVFAACGGPSSNLADQATQLRQLNPAARLGGTTIVGTDDGQRLAVSKGPAFVMALGPNETIVGSPGNDELGSRGANTTIYGGGGDDFIYGGPHSTLVGGPGRDLLADSDDNATIQVTGSDNEVVVSGHGDRVSCAPGSQNDLIFAGSSDSVDPNCLANHAQIRPAASFSPASPGFRVVSAAEPARMGGDSRATLLAATTVKGQGTNADPFVAPCDNPSQQDCTVSSFPARSLKGVWANEYVPAYKCPDDHSWLLIQNYAPPGTTLVQGVEIRQPISPWPISVSIVGWTGSHDTRPGESSLGKKTGTTTGFPNSSATNWSTGYAPYQVVLHCTSRVQVQYHN